MDSFELWKQVCGNELLRSTHFVILLNKCDLLEAKLKAGARFCKYVTSYDSKQPNDLAHVSECELSSLFRGMSCLVLIAFYLDLKTKFVSTHHQLTPVGSRKLYTHLTCATVGLLLLLILSNPDRTYCYIFFNRIHKLHLLY